MRHFGKKMMFLATMVMALTMIIWTAGAKADSVIIGNNGYPYGKNMDYTGITFIVDIGATVNGTYQWYVSDNETSGFSEVANTSGSFLSSDAFFETTFTPLNGKWYKCRINNDTQCETTPIMAKSANGRWYISNGTMAYSFFESNKRFDVIGQIDGTWVTQTSYDTYWNFYTSEEATPTPIKVDSTSPSSSATLKSAKARFNTSNPHVVNFEATIGENEHAFAFGCDVKIRKNDSAPTTAIIASRTGSVKQMQLVDTENLATAADTAPAMVVKYTTIPTHFWIGKWNSRYYYATNDKNTSTCYIDNYCSWNDAGVCYQYQGGDSGMTVSWTNRNGGDTIGFSFALGTVAETGAITGKIDYSDEKIESLKANTTYVITVLDEDGNPTSESYTITSDSNGAIHLSGTDDNNNEYDLIGKSIQIGIKDSMADPAEMDIAPRPDAENPHQSSGTDTYIKPEDVSDNEVSTTQNSITIKPLSETGKKQKYRLYTSTGEEISGQDWMPLGADGTITFAGLSPNTSYLVKAYLPATQSAPRSEYTRGTLITTLGKINVTLPSPTEITYDGDQHTFQITVNPADAAVAYSTSESVDYSNTIPTFANAGDYTVYYRVLKENYTSEYGSFPVKIKKAVNPTTVSGGTVGKGGKVLDLTSLVTMNGATGDLTYSIQGNNLGCSISGNVLTTGQNTGNITIKVVVASDDNYQEKTVTTNVEITSKGQQTLQFEEPSVEKTYDPTPFVNALSGAKTTVTYEVTNGTDVAEVDESNGFVTIKKVGSATITASAIETDEYYAAATSFILTVNKASFDSTVSISGWTYGSTASAPTVSNNPEGGNVTYVYYTDEECNTQTTTSHGATEAGGRPSYAGNYWVTATIAETANYASVTTAATGFTISPAALIAANVTITEAVKNGTPSSTATVPSDANYTSSNVTWDPNVAKFLGGTSYTASVTLTPKANYVFADDPTVANYTVNEAASDSAVKNTDGTITVTKSYTTEGRILSSIAVKTNPTKMVYTYGDSFEPAGLVITATYDDGTTEDIAYTATTSTSFSFSPASLVAATTNVDVTYGGKNATITGITVNKASYNSTISISGWTYGSTASDPTVNNNPEGGNVTYVYYTDEECNTQTTTSHGATEAGGRPSYAGDYWVKATIAETANYASVTTAAVGFTISPAALAAANVTITEAVKNGTPSTTATVPSDANYTSSNVTWDPNVSKFLGGTTYTASVTLTPKANYVFAANPAVANYTVNETASDSVTKNSDGTITVTKSYTTEGRILSSIAVKTNPTKMVYTYGDSFEPAGLVITATYDDGTTEDITYTETTATSFGFSPTSLVAATTSVDVTYGEKTATITNVTVNKAEVSVPVIGSKVYNTQTQIADVPENTLYTVTKNEGGVSVGNYDVELTLVDPANYKWGDGAEAAAKTLTFQIVKATPTVTTPTVEEVLYDPTKTLADIGLPDGWSWVDATIVPIVNNNGYDAQITVDDANYDYTGVEGYDDNSHTVTRTVTVIVNSAAGRAATVTVNSRIYDTKGEPLVIVDESTLVGGTMYYALGTDATTAPVFDGESDSADKKWSTTVPVATDVGTYFVWYMVKGDENHQDTVPACLTVKIVSAVYTAMSVEHGEHTINYPMDIIVTVERNVADEITFDMYTGATMDGNVIPAGATSTAKGSLILTLKSSYLDTLSVGDHKVTVTFKDGSADAYIRVVTAPPAPTIVPKTGDGANLGLWIGMVLLGLLGIVAFAGMMSQKRMK